MADTNTATDPATTNGQATDAAGTLVMMWATKDEADSNKPKGATKAHKPYQVSKAGAVTGWIWARGYDNALALAAKAEGFSVSTGRPPVAVTKEVIAAKLATLSDDELWAMGLTRKPAKGKK
jgi:hypothetical protein